MSDRVKGFIVAGVVAALAALAVMGILNHEPPAKNMYGGVNYTRDIIGAKMVFVPDSYGVIKCSYAVDKHIVRSSMLSLDCEDGQGITYIDD